MTETIQPHILVVDDDPQIRDLLNEYLAQNELRVSVTSTGKEMSAILTEQAAKHPGDGGPQLPHPLAPNHIGRPSMDTVGCYLRPACLSPSIRYRLAGGATVPVRVTLRP